MREKKSVTRVVEETIRGYACVRKGSTYAGVPSVFIRCLVNVFAMTSTLLHNTGHILQKHSRDSYDKVLLRSLHSRIIVLHAFSTRITPFNTPSTIPGPRQSGQTETQ